VFTEVVIITTLSTTPLTTLCSPGSHPFSLSFLLSLMLRPLEEVSAYLTQKPETIRAILLKDIQGEY
jgi:hypothetical protein